MDNYGKGIWGEMVGAGVKVDVSDSLFLSL